jgi:hypothetical protein
VLDRPPQVALHVEPAHHLRVHRGVEDRVAALAVGLRAVHGDVGVAHHLVRRRVRGGDRDPDRRVDEQLAPLQLERDLQRRQDALGDHRRLAGVADVVEQERELVAAQARDRVVGTQCRKQPLGDGLEQLVADVVAQRVVDDLEAVEVEEQHRGAAVGVMAARAADRLVEAVEEQHAVR